VDDSCDLGATSTSAANYIAIRVALNGKTAAGMQNVSDEQYKGGASSYKLSEKHPLSLRGGVFCRRSNLLTHGNEIASPPTERSQ